MWCRHLKIPVDKQTLFPRLNFQERNVNQVSYLDQIFLKCLTDHWRSREQIVGETGARKIHLLSWMTAAAVCHMQSWLPYTGVAYVLLGDF